MHMQKGERRKEKGTRRKVPSSRGRTLPSFSLSSRWLFRNHADRRDTSRSALVHHLDHAVVEQGTVGFQKNRLVSSGCVYRGQPCSQPLSSAPCCVAQPRTISVSWVRR